MPNVMQQPTPHFDDRLLLCADCQQQFVFTAGEQLFFHDKQFRNDPKRCKPCKSRRSGLSAAAAIAAGAAPANAGPTSFARAETRTQCSECGIQTTVPFRPTQGRPVLCRQCFQTKGKATLTSTLPTDLTQASIEPSGRQLSPAAAELAAASVLGAPAASSIATPEEIKTVLEADQQTD